jgi:ribA/ribD-fused uncharacterized protein
MKKFEKVIKEKISKAKSASALQSETFEMFWETASPFSQWHKCSFYAKPLFNSPEFNAEILFTSSEQYMMLHKALVFKDLETAKLIMKTNNVREQKRLGRSVNGFNDKDWDEIRVWVVYQGNKNKFAQNEVLLKDLINTKGKTLVEASPDDNIWGIGLAKSDLRAWKRDTWQGSNYLGDTLTYLRMELSNY